MNTNHAMSLTDIISTRSGLVQGQKKGVVNQFLGIPYADNISGTNRFQPPKEVTPWHDVRMALEYSQMAPQQGMDPTGGSSPVTPAFESEAYVVQGDDCLALNIWAPQDATNLPVMVWLHGGGWTTGAGSCKIYNGESLASRGDVIVVTINHRLGALGLVDLSRIGGAEFANTSNLSIRDIIAALTWVQNNIAQFGGDKNCVTIFGESGGGWKVNTMLGVPSAKGLFHRAIVESGPLTKFLTPEEGDALAMAFLEALEITADTLSQLNEISYEEVLEAEQKVMSRSDMNAMMKAPGFPMGFWPVIDGDVLTAHVHYPKTSKWHSNVPLLLGQTGKEFTLFMYNDKGAYELDDSLLMGRLSNVFGTHSVEKLLKIYRRDYPQYDLTGLWFRIFSDYAMGTLSAEILDLRSNAQKAPVYGYRFDWMTPLFEHKLYSPHTMEIPFVFDNVSTEVGQLMTLGGDGVETLSKMISEAWVSFAKTGKPHTAGLPEWPEYSSENRLCMHLDALSSVDCYIDPEAFEIFHELLWKQAGLKTSN